MKKLVSIGLLLLVPAFVAGGIYTVNRGLDAKEQIQAELEAQNITTPADASIPNVTVHDVRTAEAMAEIIDEHAREATNGLSFAEMGRFLAKDGDPAGTSVESEAVIGSDGNPVRNPLRNVAFEASSVRTGLYTSVMAFNVADFVTGIGVLVVVLGLAFGGVGIALGGLRLRVPFRQPSAETVEPVEPAMAPAAA